MYRRIDEIILECIKYSYLFVILVINKIDILENKVEIDKIIILFLKVYEFKYIVFILVKD